MDTPSPLQLSHAEVLQRLIVRREAPALGTLPVAFAEPVPPVQAPDRMVAVALGRAADKLYGLPVHVEGVKFQTILPDELPELCQERSLLAVVHGRNDKLGVVALCPNVVASLIEMQATGRVTSRPVVPRKPTRTDAAISAEFINLLLTELGHEILGRDGALGFSGFSYASHLDNPRPLLLMLDDAPLSGVTIQFRIGQAGQREGSILLALPQAEHSAFPAFAPEIPLVAEAPTLPLMPPAQGDLRDAVQAAPVDLVGILCRKRMTLQQLQHLRPGDMIRLPGDAIQKARLETLHGQLLLTGKLGEAEGFFAIRYLAEDAPLPFDEALLPPTPLPDAIDMTEPDGFRSVGFDDESHEPSVTTFPTLSDMVEINAL